VTENEITGASKSLQKTINEICEYMAGEGLEINSEKRQIMYSKFSEISRWWAEEGFKKGVECAIKAMSKSTENIKHDFGEVELAPGYREELKVAWPKRPYRRNRAS
jgi:hypothetical protein